jgi:anti-sigma28 factor (negative regulator of flagellin synthesis)
MFIGKKNNSIVAFNGSRDDLLLNASIKGITLDSIEETTEQIVPSYNTQNDGIYYKLSEVPEEPPESFNVKQQARRQEQYAILSDPITSHIAVIRDRIANGEYFSDDEKIAWEGTIADLLAQRNDIRLRIVSDFPYKEEN